MKNLLLLFIFMLVFCVGALAQVQTGHENLMTKNSSLRFEENKGQIADMSGVVQKDILFTMKDKGMTLFFRKDGISYQWSYSEKILNGPLSISEATHAVVRVDTNQGGGVNNPSQLCFSRGLIKIHIKGYSLDGIDGKKYPFRVIE